MGGSWSSEESEEQESRILCGRSWPTRGTVSLWLREAIHFIETDRSGQKIIRFWTAPFLRQSVSPWLLSNPAVMTVVGHLQTPPYPTLDI